MAKSFKELRVWEKSMGVATLVYALTAEFPKTEIYGLTSKMRRASVSIASNIAEESARGTRKDFRQFVLMAKGSTCELQTQLLLIQRLKLGASDKVDQAEELTREVGQMLSGLAKYLASPQTAKTSSTQNEKRTT